MPSNKPLLTFVVEPDLLKRLDDYRYAHRFSSRASAIKHLLEWALTHEPPAPAITAKLAQ